MLIDDGEKVFFKVHCFISNTDYYRDGWLFNNRFFNLVFFGNFREENPPEKILDKSVKGQYVGLDDYKNVDETQKWNKIIDKFPMENKNDVGVKFNDVLRWEHKQIKKKINSILSKPSTNSRRQKMSIFKKKKNNVRLPVMKQAF